MFSTRDGTPWEPEYLVAINGTTCIGCGRCFKVCGRDVMQLWGVNEEESSSHSPATTTMTTSSCAR